MPITMARMMAAKASSLGRCHTRAVSSSNAVTIHARKVHVDNEPRDVFRNSVKGVAFKRLN